MHTDKPKSLSIKDYIIRRLSLQLRQSESVISNVISHQYISASNATKNSKEVEISGLGKFIFSEKKARKRKQVLEEMRQRFINLLENSNNDRRNITYNLKLKSITEEIVYIKNKIDELDK